MEKIWLNDILKLSPADLPNVRVKFNIYNGYHDPMDLYKEDPDKVNVEWLLWRKKRGYFRTGQIAVCFLKVAWDTWLLTTIKRITRELEIDPGTGGIGYEASEVEEYRKYFGRILVKYHNETRTMVRDFKAVTDDLEVLEILNDRFTGDDFPGYENVRLSYRQLKNIIDRRLPGWTAALQNQKAVYLLTDNKTGKLYVGSATAQTGMLLQRWSEYAANGHGGNVELQELVRQNGFEYIQENFQYSILENYNARMDDGYILKREIWWKGTLRSIEFGYNKN